MSISNDHDRPFGALWIEKNRGLLQRHYGVGTYVAVYDRAVIDWGGDQDTVRDRATQLVGEDVFVGRIPTEPPDDHTDRAGFDRMMSTYQSYVDAATKTPDRRRYPLTVDDYHAIAELDIVGTKTEFSDHIVVVDDVERRFSEHDHRLMIERGVVPKETVLIAGIIFRVNHPDQQP